MGPSDDNERQARGWSQADAVRAMRAHYTSEHHAKDLPGDASLLRQYKRWEAGEVTARSDVLQADHRRDLRHGHACDVPGGAASAMQTPMFWRSPEWTRWSW